jgi:hypothetical protein
MSIVYSWQHIVSNADTLSRAYIKEHKQDVKREVGLEIERSESETEFELIQMIQYLAVSTEKIAQLKEATKNVVAFFAVVSGRSVNNS